MKNIVIVLLLLLTSLVNSQTIIEVDSISTVMCTYLKQMDIKNDTLKITTLYEKQLDPYLSSIEETKVDKVAQQVFYRLQRNCIEFRDLLDRLEPPKEAVVRKSEKPTPEITKKQLRKFKKQKDFYYFEVAGDTTRVVMNKGYWTDSFTDNTVSKLTYNWLSDTEFELVFIESDNETRSNFSVKGDTYRYQVLSKDVDFYTLSVIIPGQKMFEIFKFYY